MQGIHSVIAMRRGPHWLLSDPDAKAYGTALSNALRHLPITAAQKTIDFTALGVAVMVYEGPRIGIDMQLKAQRRAQQGPQRPQPGPARVFQFTPRPPPQPPTEPPRGNPFVEPGHGTPAQAAEAIRNAPDPLFDGPSGDMTYEPEFGGVA